jgi:hypothetical protein
MVGVTSAAPAVVRVTRGDATAELRSPEDYVAGSGVPSEEARLEGVEVVFVGRTIAAAEPGRGDAEGTDLRDRVLLFLGGEPPLPPRLFAAKNRVACPRGDDEYDRAAQLGAAGAFIVHTDDSAGCGWASLESSWAEERLALPAVAGEPSVRVVGWVTEEAARRLSRLGGHDLEALSVAARRRDFRPVPLGVRVSLALENVVSRQAGANVIGLLRGRDADLGREAVVYTAPALDDPAGVAALLAIAEAFAALPQRPRRSILFAAAGGGGRDPLGSRYLAGHPPEPLRRYAAHLDVGGINVVGRTRHVPVIGLGRSTLDDWIPAIAQAQGRVARPAACPGRESCGRSDVLDFVRRGVPSAGLAPVPDAVGALPDEPGDGWAGVIEDARLLFHLGAKVANAPLPPVRRPSDEGEVAGKRVVAVGR